MVEYYKTVSIETQFELIEKKSRFIAMVLPAESESEALALLETVKKKHYDASHNCYAYRFTDLNDSSEKQRYSDDGEPSGTAGMPILNVIKSQDLTNLIIIVTRYFGGTLLGAGGLVRAYSSAASGVVSAAGVSEMRLAQIATVTTDYPKSGAVQYAIESGGYFIRNKQFTDSVKFEVLLEHSAVNAFVELIKQTTANTAAVKILNHEETEGKRIYVRSF